MSYQYPPPPGDEMPSAPDGSFGNAPTVGRSHEYSRDVADGSYPSPDKIDNMKRAISTPNIRGQSAADAALAASAEKRRNKLGYHRTSVACVHCRRRKIRCLIAGDSQNRCENCIRLKKDCHFQPVEASSPMADPRGTRGLNGSKEYGTTSSTNSPVTQMYPQDIGRGLPLVPMKNENLPPNIGVSARPYSDGLTRGGQSMFDSQSEFPNPQTATWMHTETSQPRPATDASYWRMNAQDPSLSTGFSNYPSSVHLAQQHSWPTSGGEQVGRDDVGWNSTQRPAAYNVASGPPQSYSQFPLSGSHQTSDVMGRVVPSQVPYSRDFAQTSPLPSSVKAEGSGHLAGVSSATQLPSFPTLQANWQGSVPSSGYAKSIPPRQESAAPWYSSTALPSASQVGGESTHPMPYPHSQQYGNVFYGEDGSQAVRQ